MTVLNLQIVDADLSRPDHQQAVVELVNGYASDPMGGGKSLPADVLKRLIPGLREHPTTLILLAYDGPLPIGIAVCFLGFSTFAARPLINIHDLAVTPTRRGQGVGPQLLAAVEQRARTRGCCKVTLEVQENNARARRGYEAAGFRQAVHDPAAGGALFMSKSITD